MARVETSTSEVERKSKADSNHKEIRNVTRRGDVNSDIVIAWKYNVHVREVEKQENSKQKCGGGTDNVTRKGEAKEHYYFALTKQ